MPNAIGLEDVTAGDTVAYYCGWGSNLPPQKMEIKRTTELYIILEGQSYNKFKKKDGIVVNPTLGKIERIAIPTPRIEAQWNHVKLIAEFTELMNRRKDFDVSVLRKVLQKLLMSEDLTQDDLVEIAYPILQGEGGLSNHALQEAVDELWGGVS
ncbi:hypothetical protein QT972_28965 [Microcoleus sp. herbarium7]|uniref:hypothetical protein n=1 Tax=Microcoleus sp. herbarium7 TaxID=3055435 RepID=UPI002FD1813B